MEKMTLRHRFVGHRPVSLSCADGCLMLGHSGCLLHALKWKFLLPQWQIWLVNHGGLIRAPEMKSSIQTQWCYCWYSPQPCGIQMGFLLSAKVVHLAFLDAPWLVTAISALNEGVNGHLLLVQCGCNGSLDPSGRESRNGSHQGSPLQY